MLKLVAEGVVLVVAGGGVDPVVALDRFRVERVELRGLIPRRLEAANISVTLTAPPELGHSWRYLDVHRYLVVVPSATIDALYRIHPLAPVVAIDALAAAPSS